MDTFTYLTTDELSDRIKYDARTIRNRLKGTGKLKVTKEINPTNLPQATALPHSSNALILRSR